MNNDTSLGVGSRVRHPAFGDGVIIKLYKAAYDVTFMHHGIKSVGRDYAGWEVLEAIEAEEVATFNEAEKALVRILRTYNGIQETTQLGDKWIDGTLILKPGEDGMAAKEMPIDTFFHKIVMVRDRVRVMEQRINASNLTDEEKVNLQQYITRIYGSLTSFNVLFRRKEDHFSGTKT
jgi:phosphomannomutase